MKALARRLAVIVFVVGVVLGGPAPQADAKYSLCQHVKLLGHRYEVCVPLM